MSNARTFERRQILGLGGLLALSGVGSAFAGRSALAATALKPVHIINAGGNPTLVLQELLKQQGYFEQLGLDTTTENLGDGTKMMAGLISGGADLTLLSGFSQMFPAVERGAKMKIIAGSSLVPQLTVYSKKPEIKSLKDLEGKIVGTSSPGALLHQLMIALFQKHGVDDKKVQFVNIGGSANVFRAVVAGTVDAGPAPIDVYEDQEKYGIHSLSDANMWSEIPEFTYQAAFTTDETIAKKRDVLVRVLAAYAKLYRFVHGPDSKEAFVKAWLAVLKGKDQAQMRREAEHQWKFYQKLKPFAVDLVLSEQRVEYMQRLNMKVGKQTKILPFNEVADMSLAREALKLIA